ncbi:MAG TPA: hypothetical protein VGW14_07465, partial [Thermoleophilaceae bacterium]|nr:hypothetical protein [Thermoleophilaceae bacterium]
MGLGAGPWLAGLRAVQRPWHVGIGAFALGLALAEAGPQATLAVAAVASVVLAALRAVTLGAIAAALVLCGAAAGEARLAAMDAPAER